MSVEAAQIVILGGIFLAIFILLVGVVIYAGRFSRVIDSIQQTLITAFGSVFDSFVSFTEFVGRSIASYAASVVGAFAGFVGQVGSGFTSISNFLTNSLNGSVKSTIDQIATVTTNIGTQLINAFFSIFNGIGAAIASVVSMGSAVFTLVTDIVTRALVLILTLIAFFITNTFNGLTSFIVTILNVTATGVAAAIAALETAVSGAEHLFDVAKIIFNQGIADILSAISSLKTDIFAAICTIVIVFNAAIEAVCCPLKATFGDITCTFARNCNGCSPFCAACQGIRPGVTCAGPCHQCTTC